MHDENQDWNEIEYSPRKGGRLLEQRRARDRAEREENNGRITGRD